MKFIPAPGCVLIEPIEADSIVASADRNYERKGRVVDLSVWTHQDTNIDVGDVIFFDEYSYRRFEHEGKEIYVVSVSGDGLWAIAKQDATNTNGSEVQTEGVSTPLPTDQAVSERDGNDLPTVQ